jgi:hypothetical protein
VVVVFFPIFLINQNWNLKKIKIQLASINIPEFSIFKVVFQKVSQKRKNSPPKTNHWLVVVE